MGGRIGDSHSSRGECSIEVRVERTMCAKRSVAGSVAVIVVYARRCDGLARVPQRGSCAANVHISVALEKQERVSRLEWQI